MFTPGCHYCHPEKCHYSKDSRRKILAIQCSDRLQSNNIDGPATPWYWLTLGQLHLFDWNLELKLSHFNLVPYPIIQFLSPKTGTSLCQSGPDKSPSLFHPFWFPLPRWPWSSKPLPSLSLVLVLFLPCQSKIQPSFYVPRVSKMPKGT